jgi:hypothetical protein
MLFWIMEAAMTQRNHSMRRGLQHADRNANRFVAIVALAAMVGAIALGCGESDRRRRTRAVAPDSQASGEVAGDTVGQQPPPAVADGSASADRPVEPSSSAPTGERPAPVAPAPRPPDVYALLMEVAGEYQRFERVSDWTGSPMSSDAPVRRGMMMSRCSDAAAGGAAASHCGRMHRLFAREGWDYRMLGQGSGAGAAPGQAVVMPTHRAQVVPFESVPLDDRGNPPEDYVESGGQWHRAGEAMELFVMLRLSPDTPGTDDGWVYGVLSADGRRVIQEGRIDSCLRCHAGAPHGRLFGLR